jgi:hypothetical protein
MSAILQKLISLSESETASDSKKALKRRRDDENLISDLVEKRNSSGLDGERAISVIWLRMNIPLLRSTVLILFLLIYYPR